MNYDQTSNIDTVSEEPISDYSDIEREILEVIDESGYDAFPPDDVIRILRNLELNTFRDKVGGDVKKGDIFVYSAQLRIELEKQGANTEVLFTPYVMINGNEFYFDDEDKILGPYLKDATGKFVFEDIHDDNVPVIGKNEQMYVKYFEGDILEKLTIDQVISDLKKNNNKSELYMGDFYVRVTGENSVVQLDKSEIDKICEIEQHMNSIWNTYLQAIFDEEGYFEAMDQLVLGKLNMKLLTEQIRVFNAGIKTPKISEKVTRYFEMAEMIRNAAKTVKGLRGQALADIKNIIFNPKIYGGFKPGTSFKTLEEYVKERNEEFKKAHSGIHYTEELVEPRDALETIKQNVDSVSLAKKLATKYQNLRKMLNGDSEVLEEINSIKNSFPNLLRVYESTKEEIIEAFGLVNPKHYFRRLENELITPKKVFGVMNLEESIMAGSDTIKQKTNPKVSIKKKKQQRKAQKKARRRK